MTIHSYTFGTYQKTAHDMIAERGSSQHCAIKSDKASQIVFLEQEFPFEIDCIGLVMILSDCNKRYRAFIETQEIKYLGFYFY